MDWSSGYVTEVDYTYGYYREQCPRLIEFQLLLNSYEPPQTDTTCYLELGYGQGVSANIHAAALPCKLFGTDFNPAHAVHARTLARASNAEAKFFDESFGEFLNRKDLPEFDYIVLHGIWSWVSDENRTEILEIIRRRLKVGGCVYISYNALPGWAAQMPLRHLLKLHTDIVGNEGQSLLQKIDSSIDFAKKLRDGQARYFVANPSAKEQLGRLSDQDRNYIAHEYLNRDWVPMYFSEVNDRLSAAKLRFACHAFALDGIDQINFSAQQLEIVNSYENAALRQSIRDYFLNTQFRRDIFTRGARRLSAYERHERLRQTRISQVVPRRNFEYSAQGGLGKIALRKEVYEPLLDMLESEQYRPKFLAEVSQSRELTHLPFETIIEAVTVLIGVGYASPAQPECDVSIAEQRCRNLNTYLLKNSRSSGEINFLASPVTGGAIQIGRFEQLFLAARMRGLKDPNIWADDVWAVLKAQGQSLVKDGKVLSTEEHNIAELRAGAELFAVHRLPLLLALGVAA